MQDWQLINSFANWFSAFGTIGAVITALYLARRDKRIRLRVSAGHGIIVSYDSEATQKQVLAIRITNIGHRDVQVTGIGWRIGLLRRFYSEQTVISDGISNTLPIRLRDGEEACYYIPLFNEMEWLKTFIRKMLQPNLRWRLRFTYVGKVIEEPLEQGLKKRIIDYVTENSVSESSASQHVEKLATKTSYDEKPSSN